MKQVYNLEERTEKFGGVIIGLCKNLKVDIISRPIIDQIIRSATSVGANYMEANCAISRKDFRSKIFICKKEAQETKYWLRILLKCFPVMSNKLKEIEQECQELILIFQKITNSLNSDKKKEIEN